jgi:hypothetical protein
MYIFIPLLFQSTCSYFLSDGHQICWEANFKFLVLIWSLWTLARSDWPVVYYHYYQEYILYILVIIHVCNDVAPGCLFNGYHWDLLKNRHAMCTWSPCDTRFLFIDPRTSIQTMCFQCQPGWTRLKPRVQAIRWLRNCDPKMQCDIMLANGLDKKKCLVNEVPLRRHSNDLPVRKLF